MHNRLVISSIVVTLTNMEFLQQLAKPQEVYGRVPTLAIFEGLCKVAKIGLNESSLGKVCACACACARACAHASLRARWW